VATVAAAILLWWAVRKPPGPTTPGRASPPEPAGEPVAAAEG
jgi:hypothetical protein